MLRKHPKFQRETAPRMLRRFCPDHHVRSICDIDPDDLVAAGIKGVLLDLDNTLLPWKGMHVPPETAAWVAACLQAGLKLCLLSNTRNPSRLRTISAKLGVPFSRGRMKPSREGFLHAAREIGCESSEVVVIGDQMFTDIWGGNRCGMRTIWVQPMHSREFLGTKISRIAERLVMRLLRKRMTQGR